MPERSAVVKRETKETTISVRLNLDGSGDYQTATGILFFDHMLSQLAKHGLFDLKASGTGSDQHHLVEDVGICLGKAFNQALKDKQGIVRMAHAIVPMDDSLALVALDFSGRGYSVIDIPFSTAEVSGLDTDLVRHFLESFAAEGKLNLHVKVFYGANDHHKAEAVFKALGKALCAATRISQRASDAIPSTKDLLES